MNPGPSSSTTSNIVPVTVGVDSLNNVIGLYGAGGNPIDQLGFCRAAMAAYIHSYQTIPTGVAPTGSIGNNGALTLGTALDGIYGPTGISPGIYLYFPASAIYTGSAAGLYWCVMTSTTVGTVYNNSYTPPGTVLPPTVATPFVTTGPGAYTGVTTEVAVSGVTIAGNSMGTYGALEKWSLWSFNNTANAKTGRIRFGGISGTIYETIAGANNATSTVATFLVNRGTGFQIGSPGVGFGLSTSTPITSQVDTTQPVVILNTIQLGTATDWMVMQTIECKIMAR